MQTRASSVLAGKFSTTQPPIIFSRENAKTVLKLEYFERHDRNSRPKCESCTSATKKKRYEPWKERNTCPRRFRRWSIPGSWWRSSTRWDGEDSRLPSRMGELASFNNSLSYGTVCAVSCSTAITWMARQRRHPTYINYPDGVLRSNARTKFYQMQVYGRLMKDVGSWSVDCGDAYQRSYRPRTECVHRQNLHFHFIRAHAKYNNNPLWPLNNCITALIYPLNYDLRSIVN